MAQTNDPAYREEAAVLETESGQIHGTLMIPAGVEKPPVVLIHAGSGPTDRNGNNPVMTNNSLKMLAEGLAEAGIASLRFDKRGIAESTAAAKSELDLRFETYIEDAAAWIRQLKMDNRFSSVVVLGHSEGSLIGIIAARQAEAAAVVSIAGTGKKAGDVLKEQIAASSPMATPMTSPIIDSLEAGKLVDEVSPMLAALFRPSVQPYLISWFKYDPQEEIKKLSMPVLIVQGTTDIQVPVAHAELLAQAKPDAKLVVIEGMNHILKEAPEERMANIAAYSMPDRPLQAGLLEAIIDFVKGL
jgi:pimeloyl-ACP methyl ester carboxylesterase